MPADVRSLPQIVRARAPGAPGWADASRILIVPGQPLAVLRRISAHAPFHEPVICSATPGAAAHDAAGARWYHQRSRLRQDVA